MDDQRKQNRDTWIGAKVGVITAGDDSQGINAALRAIVRMGMYVGCKVIYIMRGFKGLVDGGQDAFVEADWCGTSDIIGMGGSAIKGFKCPEFKDRATRLRAAKNLVEHGISNMVVIGGDGTMRGITLLHSEWIGLLHDMDDKNMLDRKLIQECRVLKVVCIASSIVNDVCGTDFAIGVDSALHQIIHAIDSLSTTSCSSRVAYVVQVSGGDSGCLALATGISCDASMIFIPEWPPEGNWQENLAAKVRDDMLTGLESIMVMVADGATDRNRKPITVEMIRDVLENKLKLTTITTALGDIQRGGSPSFYDRLLATRLGAEAILCLRDLRDIEGPMFMGIHTNNVMYMPVQRALEITDNFRKAIKELKFDEAVKMQGSYFQNLLSVYNILNGFRLVPVNASMSRVGILRVGKSALAQAWVTKAFIGFCTSQNMVPMVFKHGFEGLVKQEYTELTWDIVKNWPNRRITSAVYLGSSTELAASIGLNKIANALYEMDLKGLIILGNFCAFRSLTQIYEGMDKFSALQIPMCLIPMTVNNNIPGADTTIGSDTALNEIVHYCDKMKRAARGYRSSVFIVETMGHKCGYLPTMAGIGVGAETAYIRERPFNLDILLEDADNVIEKFQKSGVNMALLMRGEHANENYDLDFMHKLFSEEGQGVFECRASAIGHVQLGALPSPRDRIAGVSEGIRCAEWICNCIEEIQANTDMADEYSYGDLSKTVLVTRNRETQFEMISKLMAEANFADETPTFEWWLKLIPLMRVLTKQFKAEYHKECRLLRKDSDKDERSIYGLRGRSSIFVA